MQIEGQMALVTGGGSGLGAATARYLAGKGAKVAILDYDLDRAHAVAEQIGGSAHQTDVGDDAQVKASVAAACGHFDTAPRIVVNCAGIADAARIVGRDGVSTRLFERVIRVNLLGTYNVTAHAIEAMMQLPALDTSERGVVVNTSSAAYEDGQFGQSAYAASKGAIAAMCLPLARELAKPGIRVMAIAPGLFHTPMMESLPDEVTEKITANVPFPARLGDPAEFGQMVGDIVENPYLNGTVIRLDGAVRLPPR